MQVKIRRFAKLLIHNFKFIRANILLKKKI